MMLPGIGIFHRFLCSMPDSAKLAGCQPIRGSHTFVFTGCGGTLPNGWNQMIAQVGRDDSSAVYRQHARLDCGSRHPPEHRQLSADHQHVPNPVNTTLSQAVLRRCLERTMPV